MHEICAPVLYRNCVTDDFDSFAGNFETNVDIDQTTRLHIHHRPHCAHASYADISKHGWGQLQTKITPDQITTLADPQSVPEEIRALVTRGTKLRHFITDGITVLPNLRIISMGGINPPGPFGQKHPLGFHELHGLRREDSGPGDRTGVLPHALLDLPSAQHYCQAVAYGPLALPNMTIKPGSALKTFTMHQSGIPAFTNCDSCHKDWAPPVILGAINRYHCPLNLPVTYPIPPIHLEDNAILLRPILAMFTRANIMVAEPITGTPMPLKSHVGKEAFEGTLVEIYNFVRTYEVPINVWEKVTCRQKRSFIINHVLKPQSLAYHQFRLDQALPEVWKGKVKLRNWEDAPVCSACGYDLKVDFRSTYSEPKSVDGHLEQ
jgi:hypothetical protein